MSETFFTAEDAEPSDVIYRAKVISIEKANAKVARLVEENARLKEIPDNITSMSDGKRLVCMLKADREKNKAEIERLRAALALAHAGLDDRFATSFPDAEKRIRQALEKKP